MSFNSIEFAFFLPIFLIFYYAIYRKERSRDILLLVGSYLFYMSWYWQYAGIIALSTMVDYLIGRKLGTTRIKVKRKLLLLASLGVNLGILALFKYYNFFYSSGQSLLSSFGITIADGYHDLLLPVGISFYTFQTLSYTIDVYREKIPSESSFIKFAVFVSFFPQLVAGPIVKAKEFLPQLRDRLTLNKVEWDQGLQLIFIGLFKKIVIADLLAFLAVDPIFSNPESYSSVDLLVGLYAYSFQIYCDFSGYSDIAIGVALLMGFRLPVNFNQPYISQTPSEFWRRWHISLSSWLREYLYFSLGGNRGSWFFTARNLLLTMLIGGLWHGAGFNFILWGGFHGLILILTRRLSIENELNVQFIIKVLVNYHLIVFSWLLFRVSDMATFKTYISGLIEFESGSELSLLFYLVLGIAAITHFCPRGLWKKAVDSFEGVVLPLKSLVYLGAMMFYVGASIGAETFIYFQF